MALVIEELTTSLDVQDEMQLRQLVKQEVARALAAQRASGMIPRGDGDADPTDPGAAGGED
ncbi:MAG: hypothetical protein KC766_08330 [Myxococcales bacterium]|nr:hypothetical protein [Myxococcales bacterium]